MQPRFILITGPNAAGKTTFIEENKLLLENFIIILPDDDRKGWRKQVEAAALIKTNIILESPWNSKTITEIIYSRKREGYSIIMYQLYLNSLDESWERVLQRNNIIVRQLDKDMVKSNFNINFRNVFQHFHYFDFAYFINNSTDEKGLKVAFTTGMLIYLKSNDDQFLHVFKEVAFNRGYINASDETIMSTNKDYQNSLFGWPKLTNNYMG